MYLILVNDFPLQLLYTRISFRPDYNPTKFEINWNHEIVKSFHYCKPFFPGDKFNPGTMRGQEGGSKNFRSVIIFGTLSCRIQAKGLVANMGHPTWNQAGGLSIN